MFDKLKKAFGKGEVVAAPLAGEAIPMAQVTDPTFSQEILGKGIAIRPSSDRVVAPADGTVTQVFDTGHAVSFTTASGVELLIHVGLDTVALKGEHYTKIAETGQAVTAGQPLLAFDRAAIAAAGYDTVTPIVVCNTADYQSVEALASGPVPELDPVLALKK